MNNKPERTPEMIANGQVWVGMNYPDGTTGWEIRGTGVDGWLFKEIERVKLRDRTRVPIHAEQMIRTEERQRIIDEVEAFRLSLPEETVAYHGAIRSRDDMSWVLAQLRDRLDND